MSHWRDKARPIIREVLAATKGKPEAEIKTALHHAYPFGPRAHHPYKIWLDEIKRQRQTRTVLDAQLEVAAGRRPAVVRVPVLRGQGKLFE